MKLRNFNYNSFIKTLDQKKFFLTQVYATLIFEIFIAYIVLMYAENNNFQLTRMGTIGLIFILFVIIISITYIKSPFIKLIIFTLFSGCIGLIFSIKVDLNEDSQDTEIVKKAFITTSVVFIYLTLFGFFAAFMGARISPIISIGLFFALLFLIIIIFIFQISGKYKTYHKIIAGAIILLFSIFIIYDTISILDKNYSGDFISAALDYFLDFINLFSEFLESN